jgi:hypothetical protein
MTDAEYVCITTVRSPEGLVTTHTDYLYPSPVDPWIQDCLHRAGADGKPIVGNVTINFKDGTSCVYMVNVEPQDDPVEVEVEGPMAALGTHRCQVCGQLYLTAVGAWNCAEEDKKRHPSVPGWKP